MSYFLFPNRYQPGTKAKAEDVNADFDRVVTAFTAVDSDISGLRTATNGFSAGVAAATAAAAAAQSTATQALAVANAASGAAGGFLLLSGGTLTGNLVQQVAGSVRHVFRNTSGAANEKAWDVLVDNGGFSIRAVNDAESAATAAIAFTRSGASVTSVRLGATTTVAADINNGLVVSGLNDNSTGLKIVNTGSGSWSHGISGSMGPSPQGSLFWYDNLAGMTAGFAFASKFVWMGQVAVKGDNSLFGMYSGDGTRAGYLQGLPGGGVQLVSDASNINLIGAGGIAFFTNQQYRGLLQPDGTLQMLGAIGANGLLYGRNTPGGTPGVGLGRIYVLPVSSGVPAGMTDSDLLLQYAG